MQRIKFQHMPIHKCWLACQVFSCYCCLVTGHQNKQNTIRHSNDGDNKKRKTLGMDAPNVLRMKCPVVGNSAVGKSALVQSFISEGRDFPKNYNMTFGVDLHVKRIAIPDTNDSVEMFIYDSSGRDLYIDYLPKYWQEPDLFMVIYDVTSKSSLEGTHRWAEFVQSYMPTKSEAQGILFGNKTDLRERRVITPKEGAAVAEKLDLLYFEGSALENEGVEEPFFLLAHEWHKLCSNQKKSSVAVT